MADITAEKVAKAIAGAETRREGPYNVFGPEWETAIPDYVRDAWFKAPMDDPQDYIAALTRWRAELVAAETPRKAPVDDTAPERLRERREALGWSMTDAALVLGGACDERDIGHYEAHDDGCCMPLRTAYAAALSAAEAERAATTIDTSGPITVVAGDGMRLAVNGVVLHDRSSYVAQPGDLVSAVWAPEQAKTGPEVVDVPQEPQPVAKRCGGVVAKVWPGDTIMHIEVDGGGYVCAPIALLRAMLAAIDAQQPEPVPGPTRPEPTTGDRPEPRYKVGAAHLESTTIRRSIATLLHASYTDHEPTETTDAWRTIAADAARALNALITRLRAAAARTAWQPIETAPRDCCVIGWADEWARPDVAWYCAGSWWSGCGSPCPEVTHWMPLPEPPAGGDHG